jgi:lantibiotic transport system ATP-binding protein
MRNSWHSFDMATTHSSYEGTAGLALATYNLTKRFGAHCAVRDLSLSVPARSVYGFLGRNGAGKTTTIRLILGLLKPTSGEVHILGESMRRGAGAVLIGALVETPSLYDHLTGRENLDLTRRLLRLPTSDVDRALKRVGLTAAAAQRAGTYSLGMRQRLGIARALLGRPRLLVLDEPTNGLDPDGIADMRDLLRTLPEEDDLSILVSSHLLSEVEQIATHVGLMHEGELLLEAPLASLNTGANPEVEVTVSDPDLASAALAKAGFQTRAEGERGLVVTRADSVGWGPEVIACILVGEGVGLAHLARRHRTLEHTYHELIARHGARAGESR